MPSRSHNPLDARPKLILLPRDLAAGYLRIPAVFIWPHSLSFSRVLAARTNLTTRPQASSEPAGMTATHGHWIRYVPGLQSSMSARRPKTDPFTKGGLSLALLKEGRDFDSLETQEGRNRAIASQSFQACQIVIPADAVINSLLQPKSQHGPRTLGFSLSR